MRSLPPSERGMMWSASVAATVSPRAKQARHSGSRASCIPLSLRHLAPYPLRAALALSSGAGPVMARFVCSCVCGLTGIAPHAL